MRVITLAPVGALALLLSAPGVWAAPDRPDRMSDAEASHPWTGLGEARDFSVRPADHALQSPTALGVRLTYDGAGGRIGYLCGVGGIGPDDDPRLAGPASTFGRQGTFLGAALNLPFR